MQPFCSKITNSMKSIIFPSLLLICTLCNCQKTENKANQPLFTGKQLEGKWYWVRSIITLKFDDGTTQHADINGERSEWIEFKTGKVVSDSETGSFLKDGAKGSATGIWSLVYKDYALSIQYGLPDQYVYQYRTIDELTDSQLVITANDAQVLREYEENGLLELGGKKLVGGSVFEQFEK
jgi:hypothetical protein